MNFVLISTQVGSDNSSHERVQARRARQVAASLQALRNDVQVQITFFQSASHFFSQRHIFKKRRKNMWFCFESKYDIEDNFFNLL